MPNADGQGGLSFRHAGPRGAGRSDVVRDGQVIGRVEHVAMGAGQFGARWVAVTPAGTRSPQLATRGAAAAWLVERAAPR